MAFYKKMKINFINKYIRRKKDKMLRIMNKAEQLAFVSSSKEMKSQGKELEQMYILDNSVFVSAEENEVSNHLILQTLLRCEKMERLRFYVYSPKGEILTLYQYLHRLFLCIYLILTFKQKEEDVPELIEILKASEQILLTYGNLLFWIQPSFMFRWTMFLHRETHMYETYFMYHDATYYYHLQEPPSYYFYHHEPYLLDRIEEFMGMNEEFIYEMDDYFRFVFSQSFFVSQRIRCGNDSMEHPCLRLIMEYPSLLMYAVPEKNFMSRKEILEKITGKEYIDIMEHLHPWISNQMLWIMETNPPILFKHEMYLYLYTHRKNKKRIQEICHIYKDKHPVYRLSIHIAVRGEYQTYWENYRLSKEEGLALSTQDLAMFLCQSDMNYPEEDVNGREVTKTYCEYNDIDTHTQYDYQCEYRLNLFSLTKKCKEIAGVSKYHFDIAPDTDKYLLSLHGLDELMKKFLICQEIHEKNIFGDNDYSLPLFCSHEIPSKPIPKCKRSGSDKVKQENLVGSWILDPCPGRNETPICIMNTRFSWRGARCVPKTTYLPYPLLLNVYEEEDRILREILKQKSAKLNSMYLAKGITQYSRIVYRCVRDELEIWG